MWKWENTTLKAKRDTNNLPTVKNYRRQNLISSKELDKLDRDYVRTTIQIPNVLVVKPKPGEIIAIGPELIDGSKSVSVSKESVRMRQVSMQHLVLLYLYQLKNTLDILEEAQKHVEQIKHVFDSRKVSFDQAVAYEKKLEQERIEQIDEDNCGIWCDMKKSFNGWVLGLLICIKIIILIFVIWLVYQIYKCCSSQYRRV